MPITLFFFPAGDDDDEKQRNRHPGEPIITLRRFASCFKKTMLVTQAEEHTLTGRPQMHVVTQGGAGKGSESAHTHTRVQTRKCSKRDAFAHTIAQVGDFLPE